MVTVQIKQKVEWFQQHVEEVNTLRSQLEGNDIMPLYISLCCYIVLKATSNHVDEQLKVINTRKEQEDNEEKEFQVSI